MPAGRPRSQTPVYNHPTRRNYRQRMRQKEDSILEAEAAAKKKRNLEMFGVEELMSPHRKDWLRPKRRKAKKFDPLNIPKMGVNGYYRWGTDATKIKGRNKILKDFGGGKPGELNPNSLPTSPFSVCTEKISSEYKPVN